jgi:FkbM family methyltransferase
MKRLLSRVLSRATGNASMQFVLERVAEVAHYFMGIGPGASAGASGEAVLAGELQRHYRVAGLPLCIFDVGANQGQFLTMIMTHLRGMPCSIHAFEPGQVPFQRLVALAGTDRQVILNQMALGDASATRELFYDEPGAGIASLYRRKLDHFGKAFSQSELVRVGTLDSYCEERSIETIHLLKLDAEGHEFEVLRGANRMLAERRIRMVSFEFGGCNIDSRTFFQDFHYLLREAGFERICRITPSGYLRDLGGYRESQEQFRTTNFVAFLQPAAAQPGRAAAR